MDIAIIAGSKSDDSILEPSLSTILNVFGVKYEKRFLSAHRTPKELESFIEQCEQQNVSVYICAAGMAAHLAGAVAARTVKPVIGIPINSSPFNGLDALLSTVQMPPGIPVATVAVNGVKNAAFLALQMLGIADSRIDKMLVDHRNDMKNDLLG